MKVLILTGGASSERDVALRSADAVARALIESGQSVAVTDIIRPPITADTPYGAVVVFLVDILRQTHAQAKFRIVLKKRACPGRPTPIFIRSIGAGRRRTAVNRRTARCVCNQHSLAK